LSTTLVTGGLGYIGRHLVSLLAGNGVPVLSYNRDYAQHSEEGVTTVQGELALRFRLDVAGSTPVRSFRRSARIRVER
jgi:NAD dependent epimerase/dehydratase family.